MSSRSTKNNYVRKRMDSRNTIHASANIWKKKRKSKTHNLVIHNNIPPNEKKFQRPRCAKQ